MKKFILFALAGLTMMGSMSCSDDTVFYTVAFNPQGGSSVPSQTVEAGGRATRPANPTRDGYTFAGWYTATSGGTLWEFLTEPVYTNLTLFANWTGAADHSSLNALIAEAEGLNSADYTSNSWGVFQNALVYAKAVAAKSDATATEISDAVQALQSARTALVFTGALKAAVSAVKSLPSGAYTASSWATLQSALSAAEGVVANPAATQAQVSDALTNLKSAVDGLALDTSNGGTTSVADKAALNSAINEANGKVQSDYTADSWSAMQTALTEAKNVAANPAASQAQVDAATSNLNRAMAALQHTTVTNDSADKSALNSFIADSDKLKQADYTADSWSVFQNALANAKEVAANSAATQQQVDQAYSALQTAVNNLVLTQESTGVVSSLVNQLTSLVNSLPSADLIRNNPLLAAVATPVATLADQVRDQLMGLLGNTNDPQVTDLNSTLNGVLNALGLTNLI